MAFRLMLIPFFLLAGTRTFADPPNLAFKPAGEGVFEFDTGSLRGRLKVDGKYQGLYPLVDALVRQEPARVGYQSVQTLVDHLEGKKVYKYVDTGVTLVTKENIGKPKSTWREPAWRTKGDERVRLRFKFARGSRFAYRQEGKGKSIAAGESSEFASACTLLYHVQGVSRDGKADVRITVGKPSIKRGGREQFWPHPIRGRFSVSRQGVVTDASGSAGAMGLTSLPTFPAGLVKVGAKWAAPTRAAPRWAASWPTARPRRRACKWVTSSLSWAARPWRSGAT